MINALITSGLSTREFTFVGFLSANAKERKEKLEELKYESRTLVFYEAPHKLKESLKSMQEILGNRKVVLAREITKIHEEFIRGELSTISEEIGDTRGEYVVLVEGSIITKKDKELEDLNNLSLEEHYKKYEEEGLSKKDIIKKIAKDRKTDKNKIYQYFIDK
jgi:16S rRNA (cytidine1402-2'-O)-methyltransferase